MLALDKFDTLMLEAKPYFLIMGNLDRTDYELVGQDQIPASEAMLESYKLRGMGFLGVVGLVAGQPKTALAEPLDSPAIQALAGAFLAVLAKMLESNDPVLSELAALYALPDTRPAQ